MQQKQGRWPISWWGIDVVEILTLERVQSPRLFWARIMLKWANKYLGIQRLQSWSVYGDSNSFSMVVSGKKMNCQKVAPFLWNLPTFKKRTLWQVARSALDLDLETRIRPLPQHNHTPPVHSLRCSIFTLQWRNATVDCDVLSELEVEK